MAAASLGTPEFTAAMGLMISPAGIDEALSSLPPNIQTLGYCFADALDPRWLQTLARTQAKRLVPIAAMHHFGPVWDGEAFWRQAFEEIQVVVETH